MFIDTSALAKRYLMEAGAPWLRSMLHPALGHVVIMSHLTTVELFSLLARRSREGSLPVSHATLLGDAFLTHAADDYLVVPAGAQVLERARALIRRYPLRTLDAIQLASARHTANVLGETITFISSDRDLLAAAGADGLLTANPLDHQ